MFSKHEVRELFGECAMTLDHQYKKLDLQAVPDIDIWHWIMNWMNNHPKLKPLKLTEDE